LALLFWLTGPGILVAKLGNVALSVLSVYLTYLLAKRIFGRQVAVLSALLLSLLPGVVVYSSLVCSDVLFITLVMLVALLTLVGMEGRTRSADWKAIGLALLTGLVNGLMILTRSIGLGFLPCWIWLRWSVDGRNPTPLRRWVLAMVVGTGLILVTWTVRNYVHFHKIIPLATNGGANFWIGNNPMASGGMVFPRDEASNPLLPLIGDEIAVDETGYRLGLSFIREHPVQALKLLPAKIFYLYNSNDQGLVWNRQAALSSVQWGTGARAFMLTNLVYALVVTVALMGLLALFVQCRSFREPVWLGVVVGVCLTAGHLPFFGSDRFALPVLPFITMYAAFGLWSVVTVDRRSA
jgi:4-amino-4-deoxy-L-arabinose transferase-like glycosyltransferase